MSALVKNCKPSQWLVIMLLSAFAAMVVFAFPLLAAAANAANPIKNPLGEGATFSTVIQSIVKFANSILAPLSTLMILVAAFLYMTGGGNPEKIKIAHKVLIWSMVGIAIVLLSNGALAIIKSVLGVS